VCCNLKKKTIGKDKGFIDKRREEKKKRKGKINSYVNDGYNSTRYVSLYINVNII
jgi:hypothetical protein